MNIKALITGRLTLLDERINRLIDFELYDWIRNPFMESAHDIINLGLTNEREIILIRNDRILTLKLFLDSF